VENNINITTIEKIIGIIFPKLYREFLVKIPEGNIFEIKDTGICFYSFSDIIERNETYEIKKYDLNYYLIGQEGDRGYFINTKDPMDETIYINDLGAIGSLPMKKEADNIFKLMEEDNEKLPEKKLYKVYMKVDSELNTKLLLYIKNKFKLPLNKIKEFVKNNEKMLLLETEYVSNIEYTKNEIEKIGGIIIVEEKIIK
jgi:hypothetical protein